MPNNLENKKEKVTILIVEDDKFLRELLVRKLEAEEFKASVAVDGQEALEKVKQELPQLILLDLILPNLDGFEVLKKIKEDNKTNKIPVIILSNLGQQDEVEKCLNLGANDYLIKAHFTPEEIIEKIKGLLK